MTFHKKFDTVLPGWVVKTIVGAIITALITGASAWGIHVSGKSNDHDKRIAVIEQHLTDRDKSIDETLTEIRATEKTQADDVKEILKRLPRR